VSGESVAPGRSFYLWKPPHHNLSVRLPFHVLDRILQDIMKGFGAVPKRGAEVGGILLGTVERCDATEIAIEDYVAVSCTYERGPSYLLSASDRQRFEETVREWCPGSGRPVQAIGYYRSHTQEGLSLRDEDLTLLDDYFPEAASLALLVKPFAMRPPSAGFFFRQEDGFQAETPLEFPFRSRELGGEPVSRRRRRGPESGPSASTINPPSLLSHDSPPAAEAAAALPNLQGLDEGITLLSSEPGDSDARPRRGAWPWILTSVFALIFGAAAGAYIARAYPQARSAREAYSLGLSAEYAAGLVRIRWHGQTSTMKNCEKGFLTIRDGDLRRTFPLDKVQMASGLVVYRPQGQSADHVEVKLEVDLGEGITVSETVQSTPRLR